VVARWIRWATRNFILVLSRNERPHTRWLPFANLPEPLANLVILSTDAFCRGEGSAFRFLECGGKANADSSPPKSGAQNDGVCRGFCQVCKSFISEKCSPCMSGIMRLGRLISGTAKDGATRVGRHGGQPELLFRFFYLCGGCSGIGFPLRERSSAAGTRIKCAPCRAPCARCARPGSSGGRAPHGGAL
jgi:hypothetical protein